VLSPGLLFSFVLLGVFPLLAKWLVDWLKSQRVYKGYQKPKAFDRDLVVIGAGSGGLVAALIAATVRAKVTLIEKNKMGGDCLNTGCVPSKSLIRSARFAYDSARGSDLGFSDVPQSANFKSIMDRVQRIIRDIEPHDSVERYEGLGVDVETGFGEILSPWEVRVNGKTLTTRNIIVATGAEPFIPPIENIDSVEYLTSNNLWELEERPDRVVVLGGGPIGTELTQAFARLGSKVSQVELLPNILPREDEEFSAMIQTQFEIEGIDVLTNHRAVAVEGDSTLLLSDPDGSEKRLTFDKLIVAVGRKANSTGFGLEKLGVELNGNGTVATDEYLRTNFPNIYAIGDVAGPYQFTHTASHMAWYASVNALFGVFKKFKVDYSVIPWATFCSPEVARVGLNEQEANEKGIAYEVTTYDVADLDRAIADEEAQGLVKVLTVPGKDRILGVTIAADHADLTRFWEPFTFIRPSWK
jgi:pyruvate/2-oxoglutarate dehydrogenase complex dihydrolipoamide dehydrogenase (E3) component